MKKILGWTLGVILGTPVAIAILIFASKFMSYLAIIAMSIMFLMFGIDDESIEVYEFEIEAMKDNNVYVTSRYGGDNELKYYFLREMDGRLKTGSTDVDNSSIIEDGESKIVVYVEAPEFATGLYMTLAKWASFGDQYDFLSKEYEYHIPNGSVEYKYEIDLE